MVAIADACAAGVVPAEIGIVLGDVEGAGILERARERRLPARFIPPHLLPGAPAATEPAPEMVATTTTPLATVRRFDPSLKPAAVRLK